MLRIRESRAFTMIELIVVIVILGILAAIAAVSYQTVIDNSRKKGVEQTASQLDKEARALAAFDNSTPASQINATVTTAGDPVDGPAINDLGSGVSVKLGSAANKFVVHAANGAEACLVVGDGYGTPGTIDPKVTVASGSVTC